MPSTTTNDWLVGLGMPSDALAKVKLSNAPAASARAAAPSATAKAPSAAGSLPSPMLPDCKIVHGKVPGPKNHVLCEKHGHVVDTDARMIIAASVEDYKKRHAAPAGTAAPSATAKAPSAAGSLPSPMLPDCKIVHGKVPGPKNHVLCEKHGHVVDTDAKMIIARSVDDYRKSHPAAATAAPAAASAAGSASAAAGAPPAANAAPAADNAKQAQRLINDIKMELDEFEFDCKTHDDAQGSSPGERAVSWVARKFSSGDDPTGKLEEMRGRLVQEQKAGIAAAGAYKFAEAAKHLDAIKAIVGDARKLIQGASAANVTGAERVVTGLQVASTAGDFATEGLKVMAPPVGEALAVSKKVGVTAMQVHLGDHVNWAEFTVDIGCELFFDKLGGGKLATRVGGPLTAKLVAKFGKQVSKEFIEKAVEDVVKFEMQAVVKQTAAGVYEMAEGKEMTYEEFLSKIVEKMTDPKELLFTLLSAKIGVGLKSGSTPI